MTNLVYYKMSYSSYPSIARWYEEVDKVPEVRAITEEWLKIGQDLSLLFDEVEVVKAKL